MDSHGTVVLASLLLVVGISVPSSGEEPMDAHGRVILAPLQLVVGI